MKKYWLQLSSGRGPEECELLAAKIKAALTKEAAAKGIKITVEAEEEGERPKALKSALLLVEEKEGSTFAQDWAGSIKWVCPSPYRPKHKRKNWFAGVNQIAYESYDYKLEAKDIRTETLSATGPGGQNVNKLALAVRLTHMPTGITAISNEERSLERNKKIAMQRLKAQMDFDKAQQKQGKEKENWTNHNNLERGNPTRTFQGEKFREV